MSASAAPPKARIVRGAKAVPASVAAAGPAVAVVIPAHGQPHFLSESVASVLDQPEGVDWRLVIVDDGCPSPETGELGLSFALADPRIHYLRTANRGLSGARNLGIAHALAEWPACGALYMLDADNRMTPNTLAAGLAAMAADPAASFVYPQLSKFGITWSGHVDVPVSDLHVLAQGNFIEASSLIHRRVFEAGLRYDETMRDGYEDWEFWIQVAAAGFRGVCVPAMGLDYRYRPESMVRGSARQRPLLLDALRRRHRSLYAAPALRAVEQAHHPRYAMSEARRIACFTDPAGPASTLPRDDFAGLLWRTLCEPERTLLPPYLLFADPAAFAALRSAGLAQGALRRLEAACDAHGGRTGLVLAGGDVLSAGAAGEGEAGLVLVSTQAFAEAVAAPQPADAFLSEPSRIGLTVPSAWTALPPPTGSAGLALSEALDLCREETRDWERPERWHWQTVTLPDAAGLVAYLRREVRGGPLSNVARPAGGRSLCLAADAAALAQAAPFAAFCAGRGLPFHLALVGGEAGPDALAPFRAAAGIDFVDIPEPQPSPFRYFGQGFELPSGEDEAWSGVRGALAGHDLLVCAAPRLFPLLAGLRAQGTRTLVPLAPGLPGHRLVLAFEHAIDAVLAPTREEAERLSAEGFPDSKIAVLADDPGGVAALFG